MRPQRFRFGGPAGALCLEVAVEEPRVLEVVEALFPDHRLAAAESEGIAPPAGTCGAEQTGAVRLHLGAVDRGYELRLGSDRGWRSADLTGILGQLELVLARELIRLHPGIPLHAAGAVDGGSALLFSGPGGSGKSSLATALALRHMPVLGDDVVLLHQGRVHAFRRLFKVEEPARTVLELPPPGEVLAAVWPDRALYHPRELGTRWATPAPVGALVLPHRRPGSRPALVERRPSEVLPALLRELVSDEPPGGPAFTEVSAALGDARCYELTYWDTPAAVELVQERIGSPG